MGYRDDRLRLVGGDYRLRLLVPGGHATLVVNAGPHAAQADRLAASLTDISGVDVRVRVADDETELLEIQHRVLFDRFDRDYNRLVAYNADS